MEFKENSPIYVQIAELVIEKILTGTWVDGDKVPSVRDLAVSLEVNPNTVMHAYGYLQENGIIYTKRGIGYHVAADGTQTAKKLKREEFIAEELPAVFKMMYMLDIDIEEFTRLFEQYNEQNKRESEENNENE